MPNPQSLSPERANYRELFFAAISYGLLRDWPLQVVLREAASAVVEEALAKLAQLAALQRGLSQTAAWGRVERAAVQVTEELLGMVFERPLGELLFWLEDLDSVLERRI